MSKTTSRSGPRGRRPRAAARLASALGSLLLPLLALGAGPPELPRPGEEVVSAALHVHGSLSEGVGSMEWQSEMARRYGVDVLWWTDHDWRVQQWNHTRRFDFEAAEWEPAEERVIEPEEAYPGETREWSLRTPWTIPHSVSVVDSLAKEGTRSLRLEARDEPAQTFFRNFYLSQNGSRQQSKYSLASRVKLRFGILPERFEGSDTKLSIEIRLSDRPAGGQPRLRYVLGSMEGEATTAKSLSYELGVWNEYELDVTADAIRTFSEGGLDSLRVEDNSFYEVRLGLAVRGGSNPVVFFDDYRIETEISGDELLDRQRALAAFYETEYAPVRQFVGTEISRFRPQPHLNAFGTNLRLVDYGEHVRTDTMYYAVEQIHEQGGIVSYNHAFGPWVYPLGPETPEQKAARVREKMELLLATRLLGADVFEVGYRWRGGVTLEDHLEAWDTFAGNGIFVTGNGVNDTHGRDVFHGWGPWRPNWFYENNFVTWIYTAAVTEPDLIHALKAGRAFFGDPNLFEGTIDLATADGFPMGAMVWSDRTDQDVTVRVTEVPPDVEVRLLQVEIRENPLERHFERNVLREELLEASVREGVFQTTVALDTSVPSLARIEVHDGAGEAWAFSNPIYFVAEAPAAGIPPERLAVVLEDARLESAREFALREVRFDDTGERLTLVGDELTPGAGEIVLVTDSRGEPAAVSGAASWSYENERVVARGFDGRGSTIVVSWNDDDRVTRVSLGRGYPNPFGDGIRADYALPERTRVRLSVLDVRGRLVRVLVDETLEAGFHRSEWNGRDEAGRLVANGVYFLRLEAAGRRITTKAVKVR